MSYSIENSLETTNYELTVKRYLFLFYSPFMFIHAIMIGAHPKHFSDENKAVTPFAKANVTNEL